MRLFVLDTGEIITALIGMLEPGPEGGLDVLRSHPRLAPWEADLTGHLNQLKTRSEQASAPERAFPIGEGSRRDRRAEAGVRVLRGVLQMAGDLAIAEGTDEDDEATDWTAVERFIFDQGSAFLGASYLSQVGQTERAVERAKDPQVAEAMGALSFMGRSLDDILERVSTNNTALLEYATPVLSSSNPTTLSKARREALSLLRDFLPVVDRTLSPADASNNAERHRLLGALLKGIANHPTPSNRPSQPASPPQDNGDTPPEDPNAPPDTP